MSSCHVIDIGGNLPFGVFSDVKSSLIASLKTLYRKGLLGSVRRFISFSHTVRSLCDRKKLLSNITFDGGLLPF